MASDLLQVLLGTRDQRFALGQEGRRRGDTNADRGQRQQELDDAMKRWREEFDYTKESDSKAMQREMELLRAQWAREDELMNRQNTDPLIQRQRRLAELDLDEALRERRNRSRTPRPENEPTRYVGAVNAYDNSMSLESGNSRESRARNEAYQNRPVQNGGFQGPYWNPNNMRPNIPADWNPSRLPVAGGFSINDTDALASKDYREKAKERRLATGTPKSWLQRMLGI